MERDFKGVFIPKEIWLNDGLSAIDKVILAEIDSFCQNGECFASNKHFADLCQCTERTVSNTITKLKQLGYIDEAGFDGRKRVLRSNIHVVLTNDEDDVFLGRLENFSRQNGKNFVADTKNDTPNITINNTSKNTDKNIMSGYETEFASLWEKYPRKSGKKKAFSHFVAARKSGVELEAIRIGLDNYIKYLDSNFTPLEYTKLGSTWFCQECWNDEYKTNDDIEQERHDRLIEEILRGE